MSLFGRRKNLPWIDEGKSVFGLHEVRDKVELQKWLRSDGKTLGDPTALPWCGDYVETCIKNTLPDEPFEGDLGKNPYWARNWLHFGERLSRIPYGAVLVFSRGKGGHVGFVVGYDEKHFYVLGGNQGNSVNISRINRTRLLGATWPLTYKNPNIPLPVMNGKNIPKTTNEF